MTEQSKPAMPQLGTCEYRWHGFGTHYKVEAFCVNWRPVENLRWQPLPVETAAQEKPEWMQSMICRELSPRLSLMCTLRSGHEAKQHEAHGMMGNILESWHDAVADDQKETPVAELISIHINGTSRSEEFACLGVGDDGYRAPEGVTVKNRQPLFLQEAAALTDRTDAQKVPLCWQIRSGRKLYVFTKEPKVEAVYEYGGQKFGPIIMDELIGAAAPTDRTDATKEDEMRNAWRKRAEEAEKELSEARHEASCCDDIKLDQPLAGIISSLQKERERLQAGSQFPIDRTDATKLSQELSASPNERIRHGKGGTLPSYSQGETLMPATNFPIDRTDATKESAMQDSPVSEQKREEVRKFNKMAYQEATPTPDMLNGDPLFEVIWNTIKSWDVNVPGAYGGYCGCNGNHVSMIYHAVRQSGSRSEGAPAEPTPTRDTPIEGHDLPPNDGSRWEIYSDGEFICDLAPYVGKLKSQWMRGVRAEGASAPQPDVAALQEFKRSVDNAVTVAFLSMTDDLGATDPREAIEHIRREFRDAEMKYQKAVRASSPVGGRTK